MNLDLIFFFLNFNNNQKYSQKIYISLRINSYRFHKFSQLMRELKDFPSQSNNETNLDLAPPSGWLWKNFFFFT